MRFSGKRALVTGAASGIGKAVVSRFLQEGAEVFGADLAYADSPSPGTGGPIALKLNVAIEDDWQQLLENQPNRRHGGVRRHLRRAIYRGMQPE